MLNEVTHGVAKWGWGQCLAHASAPFSLALPFSCAVSPSAAKLGIFCRKGHVSQGKEGRMAPQVNLCTVGSATACLEVAAPACRNKVGRKATAVGNHREAVGSSCHVICKLCVTWIMSTRPCSMNKTCCHQASQLRGIPQEHPAVWGVGFSFAEGSGACNPSKKSTFIT